MPKHSHEQGEQKCLLKGDDSLVRAIMVCEELRETDWLGMEAGPACPVASCVLHSIDRSSCSALRNLGGLRGALWDATEPCVVSMGSFGSPLGSLWAA